MRLSGSVSLGISEVSHDACWDYSKLLCPKLVHSVRHVQEERLPFLNRKLAGVPVGGGGALEVFREMGSQFSEVFPRAGVLKLQPAEDRGPAARPA